MAKILKMDFYRMLLSWQFFIAVIGIAVISILNSLNFDSSGKEDIVQAFAAGDAPFFSIVILILEALPYATTFCSDWENRYIRPMTLRSSPIKYAVSKVICCFAGSILVGMLGRFLFSILSSPFLGPVDPQINSFVSDALQNPQGARWFLAHHQYFIWIFFESFERSLQGSIFAIFSLFLSTKITSTFVTLAMPVVGYYIYLNIAHFFCFPAFLTMSAVFENDGVFPNNLFLGVLYALFFSGAFCVLFGYLFVRNVKGGLENG